MQQFVSQEMADKRANTARALGLSELSGGAALSLLLASIEERQRRHGRPLIGRKENSVSTAQLKEALRDVVLSGADSGVRETMQIPERDEQVLWQRLRRMYPGASMPQSRASDNVAPAAACELEAAPGGAPASDGAAANTAALQSRTCLLQRASFEKFGVRLAAGADGPASAPVVVGLSGVAARHRGLRMGDTLVRIDGVEVNSVDEANALFAKAGTHISLHTLRDADSKENEVADADEAVVLTLLKV